MPQCCWTSPRWPHARVGCKAGGPKEEEGERASPSELRVGGWHRHAPMQGPSAAAASRRGGRKVRMYLVCTSTCCCCAHGAMPHTARVVGATLGLPACLLQQTRSPALSCPVRAPSSACVHSNSVQEKEMVCLPPELFLLLFRSRATCVLPCAGLFGEQALSPTEETCVACGGRYPNPHAPFQPSQPSAKDHTPLQVCQESKILPRLFGGLSLQTLRSLCPHPPPSASGPVSPLNRPPRCFSRIRMTNALSPHQPDTHPRSDRHISLAASFHSPGPPFSPPTPTQRASISR